MDVLIIILDTFNKKYVLSQTILSKRSSILFESYDLSQKIWIVYLYKVAMSIRPILAHAKKYFRLPQSRVKWVETTNVIYDIRSQHGELPIIRYISKKKAIEQWVTFPCQFFLLFPNGKCYNISYSFTFSDIFLVWSLLTGKEFPFKTVSVSGNKR